MFNTADKNSIELSGIQIGDKVLFEGQMVVSTALDPVKNRLTLSNEVEIINPQIIPSGDIFCVVRRLTSINHVKTLLMSMEDDFAADSASIESGETNPFDVMRHYVEESYSTKLQAERSGYTFRLAQDYLVNFFQPGDILFANFRGDGIYPVILKKVGYPFMHVAYPYGVADSEDEFDNYTLGMLSLVPAFVRRADFETQDEFFAQVAEIGKSVNSNGFTDELVAKQVSLNYQNGMFNPPEELEPKKAK